MQSVNKSTVRTVLSSAKFYQCFVYHSYKSPEDWSLTSGAADEVRDTSGERRTLPDSLHGIAYVA